MVIPVEVIRKLVARYEAAQSIDMATFRIINVGDPVFGQDAATRAWVVANQQAAQDADTSIGGQWNFLNGLDTDDINEHTPGAGVTVDGVLLKDGLVDEVDVKQGYQLFNGAVVETIDITITESGGTVSLELQKSGGGDLSFIFEAVTYILDCTPADTVALTAGTDTAPTLNYVYVTEAAGVLTLTKNTTGWPTTSHAPVATVLVQSAASVATDGAYKVHAWTDHISKATENGHLSHINRKLRALHAAWIDGVTPADLSVSDPNAYLSTTAGNVFQLHPHAMPAWDMSGGEPLFVVNDPTTAFLRVTSFASVTQDADGTTITTNKFVNVVLWGVVSEKSGDCQFYLNLPHGLYNIEAQAQGDDGATSVYTIPGDFVGTGFLVARYTLKKTATGWIQSQKESLLGQIPSSSVGGSGAVDTSAFLRVDGVHNSTGLQTFEAGIATDTIAEETATAGVTIDGVLLKDGAGVDFTAQASAVGTVPLTAKGLTSQTANIQNWMVAADVVAFIDKNGALNIDTILESTAAAGVTIDGVKLKDSEVYTDTIHEKTVATGVTTGLWRIVKKDRVAVTRTNSTTHITDTYSIPAGAMGADGGIRGRLLGSYENTSGVNKSLIFKVSLGSTVLFQDTDSIPSATGKRALWYEFEVWNANATGVQECRLNIVTGTNGNATVGYGNMDIGGQTGSAHGSAACTEDSTGALTLTVEIWTSTTAATVQR
jgi:hypothetical protein